MEERMYLLMAKALSNEATADERRELNDWLETSAENRTTFDMIKDLWQKTEIVVGKPEFDVNTAWAKVEARTATLPPGIAESGADQTSNARPLRKWWTISGVAASIIIIVIVAYNFLKGPDMISASATDHTLVVTLPDQSTVNLSPGSTLLYPEDFDGSKREMSLTGEAFFEVTRNEQKPFIVKAQSTEVRVLGTSFNVNCTDSTATVAVRTGKVQMTPVQQPDQKLVLTRGNKGIYNNKNLTKDVDTNYTYYSTGVLDLNDRTLEQAAALIAKVKNTAVVLDKSLSAASRDQKISLTLKKEHTIAQMLDELCLITNTRWIFEHNRYVIYAK